jgi:hypothetical protein
MEGFMTQKFLVYYTIYLWVWNTYKIYAEKCPYWQEFLCFSIISWQIPNAMMWVVPLYLFNVEKFYVFLQCSSSIILHSPSVIHTDNTNESEQLSPHQI